MLHTPVLSRASFWLKIALGIALVGLADFLFLFHPPGTTIGLFILAVVAVVVSTRKGLMRDRRALSAITAACAFGLVLADRPGLLAWLLSGLALTVAVFSARVRSGESAWGWAQRLLMQAIFSLIGPVIDATRVIQLGRRQRQGLSILALLARLVMPVIGGAVFLALFSAANPLISDTLARLALPELSQKTFLRLLFWGFASVSLLALLRPRWHKTFLALPTRRTAPPSAALTTSITWSLIVFNAVFALQNGLDIAFLWSGAPLPGDMGLADYAHRGAYPLIVTALLAGLFVLITLSPGSDTAKRPLVRRLVVVWIAQNMLLVASSLLRTADYIEAYALTRFRIAAMVWMVLVGVGLILICWRMLRDKSAHWLIDANVVVVLIVFSVASVIDLGAVAASWNVRHAREVGGRGVELDLGYLHSLGEPALVSLVTLEQTTVNPVLRDRAAFVRRDIVMQVRRDQKDWHSWTWRAARRLNRVQTLTQGRPPVAIAPGQRDWDGRLLTPGSPSIGASFPSDVTDSPLTSSAGA